MSHNLEFWKSGMLGRLLTLDSLVRALGMRIQADSRFLEKFSKFIFFDFYGRWSGRGRGMCGRRRGSTGRYLFRFDTSLKFLFFGFEFTTFLLQFSQILFLFQFLLKHMIRIPTVKLKILAKLFFKAESRTSVTFKL